MTPEEKLKEVQQCFDNNVAQAQQIEQQIAKMQEQLRDLQQPLIEDQGAIKRLKELVETVEQNV
tara:strand:+ start:3070 stop:3261 length:192 start_codon:yes stop_codon:yes gene_type:complete